MENAYLMDQLISSSADARLSRLRQRRVSISGCKKLTGLYDQLADRPPKNANRISRQPTAAKIRPFPPTG